MRRAIEVEISMICGLVCMVVGYSPTIVNVDASRVVSLSAFAAALARPSEMRRNDVEALT
jgi:hypothetical protein